MTWQTAMLSVAFCVVSTCAFAQSPEIQIQRARYANAPGTSGNHSCDATEYASECNGHPACHFQVNNDMCGDPAPHVQKKLTLSYSCGKTEPVKNASAKENDVINLSCE